MGVDHLASYGTQGVTSKWCYDGRYATLSIAVNTWRCCYPPVTLGRSAQRCGKRVKTLFVNMVFGTFPVIEIWNQTVCNPTSKKHHFDHTVLTQMWDIGATPLFLEMFVYQTQWTSDPLWVAGRVGRSQTFRRTDHQYQHRRENGMKYLGRNLGWRHPVDSDFWEVIDLEVWEFLLHILDITERAVSFHKEVLGIGGSRWLQGWKSQCSERPDFVSGNSTLEP